MKKNSIDMTKGPIAGPLIRFILPLIGSSIFQQLYNTVDFLYVGNFMNKTAAAAVGASSTLIYCTIGLFSGISVGTSVVAAQAIGSRNIQRGEKALHTSVVFGAAGGVVIAALGILFAPGILQLLRTPQAVMSQAVQYMRIYMISVPMMIFYNMVSGGIRAGGDSKSPFTVLVICGFLNVLMDAVFIVWIPLGVAGVSIATVISQSLSAVLIAIKAAGKGQPIRLSAKKLRIDGPVLGAVLRIGLPTGIQTIIITFSNIMVQYYINDFGETAVAAFAAYYKVENFLYLPIVAFGQASTTFSGQNTGALQFRRIRKGTFIAAAVGFAVVGIIAAAILLAPRTVFTWFIKDQSVVDVALKIALVSFPLYWLCSLHEVLGGAARGMGYSVASMLIIIGCMCVIRVSLLAFFSARYHTVQSLAAVYPSSWGCAAIGFALLFFTVKSKKIRDCQN